MTRRKLLWIGWDGADWEHITPLLDAGQLPHLERLIDNGVMGNLATHHPVLSPMLWNTAATGKQAYKHGVLGFIEPDPIHGGARPFQSTSRSVKAIWNILSQNGYRANVVNWWASHPAEPVDGCIVSNMFSGMRPGPNGWKWPAGSVHPEPMASELSPFLVLPEEMTGDELLPFVPQGKDVCQDDDPRLSILATHLAEMISTQGIATHVMERSEWDFMAVYFTAIDHFCHSFMSFHPPRLPWISEEDFEMYRHVIPSVYRMSDLMLGRMVEMAGPDATIVLCSDHGFQSGPLRLRENPNEPAGPAHWHRQYGIFVASGPGLKRDERIYSATLVDICPTLLTLFGLPVGQDMDGRVLRDVFEEPPTVETIPSWETVDGNGRHGRHGQKGLQSGHLSSPPLDLEESDSLLQQFVALGYVDAQPSSREEYAALADVESKYNLGRNLNSVGQHVQAIPIFLDLVHRAPWESRFIIHLIRTFLSANQLDNALQVIVRAYDLKSASDPVIRLMHAEIQAAKGNRESSYAELCEIEKLAYLGPGILMQLGMCFLYLQKLREAERIFYRVLSIHPDHAEALQGLSSVLVRKGDNQLAAETALHAVSLLHRQPIAHLNLGIALARGGDPRSAVVALETALKFQPFLPKAHRWLQIIYMSMLPDPEKAEWHGFNALQQSLKRQEINHPKRESHPAAECEPLALPEFPNEEERERILASKRSVGNPQFRESSKEFILVSGLPRSGTSVMMQMLEAGGLPAKTDGLRQADLDNPRGYFEWEQIKSLANNPTLFDEKSLENHAIKVVSPLLSFLPYQHHYKIIFMTRTIAEVVASQSKMIDRLNTVGADWSRERLEQELEMHRESALRWLEHHPRAQTLLVDYGDLLREPETWVTKVVDFVGPERLPQRNAMVGAIVAGLRRNQSKP